MATKKITEMTLESTLAMYGFIDTCKRALGIGNTKSVNAMFLSILGTYNIEILKDMLEKDE